MAIENSFDDGGTRLGTTMSYKLISAAERRTNVIREAGRIHLLLSQRIGQLRSMQYSLFSVSGKDKRRPCT